MKLIDALNTRNLYLAQDLLTSEQFVTREINEAFQEACKLGYKDFVALFLNDSRVNPQLPSIQALDYAISPAPTGSFGLQQAAYYGHLDIVEMLLQDKRSDLSAGNYRCLKLIVDKAGANPRHKQILKRLTDYCWDNYMDYKKEIGPALSDKINDILHYSAADQDWSHSQWHWQ